MPQENVRHEDVDMFNQLQDQRNALAAQINLRQMLASPEEFHTNIQQNHVIPTLKQFVSRAEEAWSKSISYYLNHLLEITLMQSRELALLHALETRVMNNLLDDESLKRIYGLLEAERASVKQRRDMVQQFADRPGFKFMSMADLDGNLDYSDEVHAKPHLAKVWSTRLAGLLNSFVCGAEARASR